jgi:SNF2 family DNA or RNA helicase
MQVRTGKTLTSLGVAQKLNVSRVLFVTKKKAISSIEEDYQKLKPQYNLTCINYESLHKVEGEFDFLVLDEAHTLGAYPKPSKRTKLVKELIKKNDPYVIIMSGTPTPESFSQMYHQVYGCPLNPFKEYKTFYKFAKEYVNVTQRIINSFHINNYDDGKPGILEEMKPFMISYTQKEAGFKSEIKEHVLKVEMSELTYDWVKKMREDKLIEGKKTDEVILGDTEVKKMSKIHQLFSGTVKMESGKSMVTDLSKAKFIRTEFKDNKIGIFYKFKAEYDALKQVYGDDLTTELNDFNNTNKSIALQIVSGREGISLKEADCLVYYNIDFSALSYWQSRDRMTTKDSKVSDVYWIFAERGIETKIYKAVTKKKDYTLRHFKKDLLSL